jgi:hypothetical protein
VGYRNRIQVIWTVGYYNTELEFESERRFLRPAGSLQQSFPKREKAASATSRSIGKIDLISPLTIV